MITHIHIIKSLPICLIMIIHPIEFLHISQHVVIGQ